MTMPEAQWNQARQDAKRSRESREPQPDRQPDEQETVTVEFGDLREVLRRVSKQPFPLDDDRLERQARYAWALLTGK